jgi:hypothetical protein
MALKFQGLMCDLLVTEVESIMAKQTVLLLSIYVNHEFGIEYHFGVQAAVGSFGVA